MKEIKVPELGESIKEGTIAEWVVKEGSSFKSGDLLAEIETDKVNIEINADSDGVLKKIVKQAGEPVKVQETIAQYASGAEAAEDKADEKEPSAEAEEKRSEEKKSEEKKSEAQPTAKKEQENESLDHVIASPSARRWAREHGKQLHDMKTDPMGRVQLDSENGAEHDQSQSQSQHGDGASNTERPVETVRMSRRRQTIAKRLVEAQHTAAMLTTFNEVDMSAIIQLRKRRKESFQKKHDVKLGFMSFFTKAAVGALKEFPYLNAEIEEDSFLLKKYYDIGIAVAADEGLVVPVVRNADRMNFAEIERKIIELSDKAVNNKLSLDELQGGSFTITNGGVFGSLLSTPILNTPQVGILGMHTIQTRPVAVDEKQMENRPMMYVALSYDHRIVDGKEAVQFLMRLKEMLEDPETLMLEA